MHFLGAFAPSQRIPQINSFRTSHRSSLCATASSSSKSPSLSGQKILVTGGTGLIGRALIPRLVSLNASVTVLARDPIKARELFPDRSIRILLYDSSSPVLPREVKAALPSASALVNLAGEPIDAGRWTPNRKDVLCESRLSGTRALASAQWNGVFVSASAVGYYGADAPGINLDERAPAGSDFLARLAVRWEAAVAARRRSETKRGRTVILRLGVILARTGGALPRMAAAFRAFVGGPPGGGKQWFSWVHLHDAVEMILWAITDGQVNGIYNCTAPKPVRLAEFCTELGRALERPSWLPVPALAIKSVLGSEAAQLVLAGQHVVPERALRAGFKFRYTRVSAALSALFEKEASVR